MNPTPENTAMFIIVMVLIVLATFLTMFREKK